MTALIERTDQKPRVDGDRTPGSMHHPGELVQVPRDIDVLRELRADGLEAVVVLAPADEVRRWTRVTYCGREFVVAAPREMPSADSPPRTRVVRVDLADRPQSDGLQPLADRCLEHLGAGRWTVAEAQASEGLRRCGPSMAASLPACQFRYARAVIASLRGDRPRAQALAEEMERWVLPHPGSMARLLVQEVRVAAAMGAGEFEEAHRLAAAAHEDPTDLEIVRHPGWLGLDLVESAVRIGQHDAARAHVARLRAVARARTSPRRSMLWAAAEAMVAPDDMSEQAYRAALSLTPAGTWPFDEARILLAHGERLRRMRLTTDARTHLTRARDLFRELGAGPWAERAGRELRAAGPPRSTPSLTGIGALTTQEREVALLAASGLTNKEIGVRLFLSPRTVGAHLYRIFPKLGIRTRASLRDALDGVSPTP